MARYVFISAEGLTYQPNSTSYEPDIENMQVIGFGEGNAARDAFRNLLERNEYLVDTSFDEVFAIELVNDSREYFSLEEERNP